MEKNIFIFDQNKCVGCHACILACINENGFQAPDQWRNIYNSNSSHFPDLPLFYLSLACNHCDDAPCLKNCPTLAYSQDEKTGAIIHHPEKCIGCKYCTWACPFDAPKYNPKEGIIEKCTFCNHRIEEGLKPACAHLCPVGALDFKYEEFSRTESVESSPVPVNIGSKIKIKKLRNNSSPEIDLSLFKESTSVQKWNNKHNKTSARKEWPLVIFTLLSVALFSIYASGIANTFNVTYKAICIIVIVFAAILSMLHLGKKARFWRSIFNIRNSWLSKEIIFFTLFFAGVFCDFYLFDLPNIIVSFLGLLLLFSIDMLYQIATWRWPLKIHSAQTILIGITLVTFLLNFQLSFLFIISFRLTLYTYRKYINDNTNYITSIIRIILPISAIIIGFENNYILSLILISLGEIIDRIEFYNELNLPVPYNEFEISYSICD